jgi:hypothetical protein
MYFMLFRKDVVSAAAVAQTLHLLSAVFPAVHQRCTVADVREELARMRVMRARWNDEIPPPPATSASQRGNKAPVHEAALRRIRKDLNLTRAQICNGKGLSLQRSLP